MMVHNYSAGPCVLPQEVFEKAAESIRDYNGTGLSIIEMSHRSKDFVEVMDRARALVKELLNVPDGYTVLFLQGGASLGFYTSAINFMKNEGGVGAYVDTGSWSSKAIKEAKLLGDVRVLASSQDQNFNYIPKGYEVPTDVDYVHLTSNNTIFGTQFKSFPESKAPLLCDMSSDIFSKSVDVSKFDLIYAGAQKNMGPAGTTVYIVKDEALGKTGRAIPSMLDLQVHSSKDSMFNTPPVFAVYGSMLTMEWMKKEGGVSEMEKRNEMKAQLLYSEIDRNALFEGTTKAEDRSNMNPTFVLKDEEAHAARFDQMWKNANINGLKGHRSVGGYRASMYNALGIGSVRVLVEVMKELERTA
ncbi:MAG: 3-phosphoserine/phosphohydroxythreonine transaminase [Flavobacteriales bacterium]|nr:3-phosphoserine/phosphohydroxythreonine transaminase [Flavobacteriales bacterium]